MTSIATNMNSGAPQSVLAYADRWLAHIHNSGPIHEADAKEIITESVYNFANHFNKGISLRFMHQFSLAS